MHTSYARRVGQALGIGIATTLVVVLLQAAVAVKAQEPNPEDPMRHVPIHWYPNPGGGPLIGPPAPSFGEALTDVNGFWDLQIDWSNWDMFWLQHEGNGPIETGVVAAPLLSSNASVTLAAGIWEADTKGPWSPARTFEGIDVQFWKDVMPDGIFNPSGALGGPVDEPLGDPVATNGHGDAHCPAGAPCPFAPDGTPYGALYKFTISLGSPDCDPSGGAVGTIPHFFTVHGRDMNNRPEDYTCLLSLAGQLWYCEADGICELFE